MRIGHKEKGTCCLTICHRVGVIRTFKGLNKDGIEKWEYKLVNNNLKMFDKYYIREFFDMDAELDDTFSEGNDLIGKVI